MATFPERLREISDPEDREVEVERVLNKVYERVWDADELFEAMSTPEVESWWLKSEFTLHWRHGRIEEGYVEAPFSFSAVGIDENNRRVATLRGHAVAVISDNDHEYDEYDTLFRDIEVEIEDESD
jgi:hypothetical protein